MMTSGGNSAVSAVEPGDNLVEFFIGREIAVQVRNKVCEGCVARRVKMC
jgi:hypothetical protein